MPILQNATSYHHISIDSSTQYVLPLIAMFPAWLNIFGKKKNQLQERKDFFGVCQLWLWYYSHFTGERTKTQGISDCLELSVHPLAVRLLDFLLLPLHKILPLPSLFGDSYSALKMLYLPAFPSPPTSQEGFPSPKVYVPRASRKNIHQGTHQTVLPLAN